MSHRLRRVAASTKAPSDLGEFGRGLGGHVGALFRRLQRVGVRENISQNLGSLRIEQLFELNRDRRADEIVSVGVNLYPVSVAGD
jgi:hypothetical protein